MLTLNTSKEPKASQFQMDEDDDGDGWIEIDHSAERKKPVISVDVKPLKTCSNSYNPIKREDSSSAWRLVSSNSKRFNEYSDTVMYKGKCYVVVTVLHTRRNTGEKNTVQFVVDYEDSELVRKFRWSYSCGYVRVTKIRRTSNGTRKRETHFLHNILAGRIEQGLRHEKTIDHYNRIRLDNRRANLCFATKQEQNRNRGETLLNEKQLELQAEFEEILKLAH